MNLQRRGDDQSLMGLRSLTKVNHVSKLTEDTNDETIPWPKSPSPPPEELCKRVDKLELQINITQNLAIKNKQQIELINKNMNEMKNDIDITNRNLQKQVQDLSNKISNSQSSVQDQIAELKNQISQSQRNMQDQMTDMRNEMRSDQSSMQDQVSKLKNDVTSSVDSRNNQDQSNSVNVEVKQASRDVTSFKAVMENWQSQTSQQQIALEVEVRQLQKEMASVQAAVFAPQGGAQIGGQGTNVQQGVDVSELQKQIADLEKQMGELASQVTGPSGSQVTDKLKSVVENIKDKLMDLEKQVAQLQPVPGTSVSTSNTDVDELKKLVEHIKLALVVNKESLQNKITAIEAEIRQQLQVTTTNHAATEANSVEIDTLKKVVAYLKDKLVIFKDELKGLAACAGCPLGGGGANPAPPGSITGAPSTTRASPTATSAHPSATMATTPLPAATSKWVTAPTKPATTMAEPTATSINPITATTRKYTTVKYTTVKYTTVKYTTQATTTLAPSPYTEAPTMTQATTFPHPTTTAHPVVGVTLTNPPRKWKHGLLQTSEVEGGLSASQDARRGPPPPLP